eukprot:1011070-Rhodomonas_salina.1
MQCQESASGLASRGVGERDLGRNLRVSEAALEGCANGVSVGSGVTGSVGECDVGGSIGASIAGVHCWGVSEHAVGANVGSCDAEASVRAT